MIAEGASVVGGLPHTQRHRRQVFGRGDRQQHSGCVSLRLPSCPTSNVLKMSELGLFPAICSMQINRLPETRCPWQKMETSCENWFELVKLFSFLSSSQCWSYFMLSKDGGKNNTFIIASIHDGKLKWGASTWIDVQLKDRIWRQRRAKMNWSYKQLHNLYSRLNTFRLIHFQH